MQAFISRAIMPDSAYHALLTAQGWKVYGQSFVMLQGLPFSKIPDCAWMFFSSQNAVRFFFQNLEKQKIECPDAHWAALGEGTAKLLYTYSDRVDFVGTGEPHGSAQQFRRHCATLGDVGTILFPAARRSRQSVMSLLNLDFDCIHFEIYDNQPAPAPGLRTEQVLAFTSPMNAEAYFSKHPLLPHQRVVAIGGTTDRTLLQLGIMETVVAAEPSERGLAEAVMSLW